MEQGRGFFGGRAQEELPQRERIVFLERAHADEKGQRARAARQARGLRVDEGHAFEIDLLIEIGETPRHPR